MGTDHVSLRLSEHSRVLLHCGHGRSTMVHPYRPTSEPTKTHPECHGTRTNYGQLTFSRLGLRSCLSSRSLLQSWDTKAMLPRDDQYVPNGKYLRPPAATTSLPTAPVEDTPSSTTQAPTTDALLRQIIERLDHKNRKRS